MGLDYIGTEAADSLTGDYEDNTLRGLGGDDTLTGGSGNDLIEGGAGSDTFVLGAFGNDTIYANDASDPAGTPGSVETLQLYPGLTPQNLVVKQVGDDLSVQVYGSTLLKGFFDPDATRRPDFRLQFSDGSVLDQATLDQLLDEYRDDTVAGTQGDDVLTGNGGDNLLQGLAGQDILDGGKGQDRLEGGDGDDVLDGGEGNDTLWGGAGNDLLQEAGNDSIDEFHGGDGDDTLVGNLVGDKYLEGGAGSDTYVYLPWVNSVRVVEAPDAGDHDKLVMGDASDPLLSLTPDDLFLLREGDDLLLFSDVIQGHGDDTASWVTIADYFSDDPTKRSGLETIEFSDGTTWTREDVDQALRDGTNFNDVRVGTEGPDVISGKAGDDDLSGGAGNDTLDGGDGQDALQGGDGDDVLLGGAGNDPYLSGGDGNDFLDAGTGDPDVFDPWGASQFFLGGGAGNDTLVGSSLSETLSGGTGDDVFRLDAAFGYDTITGDATEAGFDTLEWNIDSSQVSSVVWSSNGRDELTIHLKDPTGEFDQDYRNILELSNFYDWATLAPTERSIDEIRFKDGVVWNLNEILRQANKVDDGNNVVHGSSVNDRIDAAGGHDTVMSGAGNDTVNGGAGQDFIVAGEGNDVLRGGADVDFLNAGAGNDRAFGGEDQDNLLGGDGNDWLDGEQGTDYISGDAGADTLIGGDGDDNLSGGLDNDLLRGGDGNDTLLGDDGADTLQGGAGNDSLNGGLGADRMDGGDGDDVYEVNDVGDVVAEAAGKGADEVRSSVSFTLGANVERLVLTEYWHRVDGIGNGQANVLTGSDSDNRLEGRAGDDLLTGGYGNDTLVGGAGNDTLDGGAGNELYLFNRGAGADRIVEGNSWIGNVDTLQIGGANSRQLWFAKAGDDLQVSIIGTHDSVTIANWYLGDDGVVEKIVAGDGKTLDHGKVDALVGAMAAFTPPASGQTTLDKPTLNALQPVLAASWA